MQTRPAVQRNLTSCRKMCRKKGKMLGKMLGRYYHLDWNDQQEQGVLKSYTNEKFSGAPTKQIHLKQYAACTPLAAAAVFHVLASLL